MAEIIGISLTVLFVLFIFGILLITWFPRQTTCRLGWHNPTQGMKDGIPCKVCTDCGATHIEPHELL